MPPSQGPNLTGKAATNYAGLMSTQPRSFTPIRPTTFAVHTDEIGVVRRPSGDHTQYLWGLVTVADD
ncbi:MAG TPA: hypothetical protein PLV25_00615 [Opitutales bacterium]|nr:hypothetical protein [Opitutales bacterium]